MPLGTRETEASSAFYFFSSLCYGRYTPKALGPWPRYHPDSLIQQKTAYPTLQSPSFFSINNDFLKRL
ncbi:hypothetical protein A946_00400 [Methylacidiphilum kamchatkense Kam1]|uniref:Uncharacterized protein n=1 Tax=Methylacidiphilum kamchatkense Kam1 TaxID=1202785 RepID=A0ABR4ZYA9_9BACT|nr:hypothetical protein A946_00400 [Methylacidiphilum kamchatkense Kam1]